MELRYLALRFFALAAVLLAGAALAKTPSPTVVRWQEEPRHRSEFFIEGQLIHALEYEGLTVSACLEDTGHEMRASSDQTFVRPTKLRTVNS